MQSSTRPRPIGWRVRSRDQRIILLIGDAFVSTIALFGGLYFWGQKDAWLKFSMHFIQQRVEFWFYLLPVIWMVFLVELYNPHRARNLRQTVAGIALAALAGLVLYALVYLISQKGSLPRLGIGIFLAFASVLTLVWRLIYIRIFTNQAFLHRVLIIGAGSAGDTLVKVYNKMNPKPFFLVGFMDDDPAKVGNELGGFPILAGNDRLLEIIEERAVSEIVIAITGEMKGSTFQVLLDAQQSGMEIIPMPSLYEELLNRVPIHHLESEWLIRSFVNDARVGGFYELAKRLLDILVALAGLAICIVLTPFTSILILLDSGFPILYNQIRSGKSGKLYNIYKFRTMCRDAEKDGKVQVTHEHDDRITRVGGILRRTHIDELPQFWNVLRGDMSIVGPRAERPELIIEYQKHIPLYRARLLVKPGITGWAQVNFGYSATIAQTVVKLEYDLYYIKHRNIVMDILIILRTMTQVVGFQGR
ncbi:MAG: sugar transferase [Anaerolineales bacterium]|jgi:exopolysaccharide biosynthesis polyprenyl glycosylphosphotransferase